MLFCDLVFPEDAVFSSQSSKLKNTLEAELKCSRPRGANSFLLPSVLSPPLSLVFLPLSIRCSHLLNGIILFLGSCSSDDPLIIERGSLRPQTPCTLRASLTIYWFGESQNSQSLNIETIIWHRRKGFLSGGFSQIHYAERKYPLISGQSLNSDTGHSCRYYPSWLDATND